MSKQSLLLVDGDTRSLRVLEVSLRKAGFMVTAATSVQDALDKLELHAPDLIISETTFPDGDGFELRRRVRATPEWSEIPFIFLTAEAAIENKIRGLELGVDDYLTKPIYIKEIVTRINILLQKRQRVRFEERRDGRTRFAGRVQDMPVVDVIQTIEISRKSGVIQFVGERGRQAAIYFRDGRVIDAEAGSLQGEDAVYRLLTWSEGEFEVVFRTVRRREVITMSSQALLMEGMRRLDEWSRLFEQLPPLTHRFEVDTIELAARLGDVPDDNNRILRLFDGKRTLLEVIDASDVGDLECLQAISRLYFEELLLDLDHGKSPRRDTGKTLRLVEIDGPGPVTDESSGPIGGGAAAASAVAAEPPGAKASGAAREELPPAVAESEDAAALFDDAGAGEPEAVGPLMGGYRPSSLRLIDEAVAAAQAIEPSLFEDSSAQRGHGDGHDGHTGNGVSRTAIPAAAVSFDEAPTPSGAGTPGPNASEAGRIGLEPAASLRVADREDSGLRMIGSLGRDRAEASGELATLGQSRPLRSETARELVTILPRRITRELPVMTQELAESLPMPTPTSPVLAPRPTSAVEPAAVAQAAQAQRIALPGTGVRALSRSRRLLRIIRSMQDSGPGLGAMLLIALAVVLAATAVLLRLRRHTPQTQVEVVHDAAVSAAKPAMGSGNVLQEGPGDIPMRNTPAGGSAAPERVVPELSGDGSVRSSATVGSAGPDRRASGAPGEVSQNTPAGGSAAPDRGAPALPGDGSVRSSATGASAAPGRGSAELPPRGAGAGAVTSPAARGAVALDAGAGSGAADNAAGGVDAGKPAARADGGVDRVAAARELCDLASNALAESDFSRAFELASESLKLRRTARGYVLRARAEQRLGRVDDALRSLDVATELAPTVASVWEQRGWILWGARRRDEARVAFERALELDPKTPKAAEILRLLNEPR